MGLPENQEQREVFSFLPLKVAEDLTAADGDSKVLCETACILYYFHYLNTSSSQRYILFFDSTELPEEGAETSYWFPVFSGSLATLPESTFGRRGIKFDSGLAYAVSSTPGIFTPAADGQRIFSAYYRD